MASLFMKIRGGTNVVQMELRKLAYHFVSGSTMSIPFKGDGWKKHRGLPASQQSFNRVVGALSGCRGSEVGRKVTPEISTHEVTGVHSVQEAPAECLQLGRDGFRCGDAVVVGDVRGWSGCASG